MLQSGFAFRAGRLRSGRWAGRPTRGSWRRAAVQLASGRIVTASYGPTEARREWRTRLTRRLGRAVWSRVQRRGMGPEVILCRSLHARGLEADRLGIDAKAV